MDEHSEKLSPEERALVARLVPVWQEARRLENPPPALIARARALYTRNVASLSPRQKTKRETPSRTRLTARRFGLYAMSSLAVAVLLFLCLGMWGTVAVQAQEALPGELSYPVKTTLEQARLAATWGEADKAELYSTFAENRVGEARDLAVQGKPDQILPTVAAYQNQVQQAGTHLMAAAFKEPSAVKSLAPKIDQMLQGSLNSLAEISSLAPTLHSSLSRAIAVSLEARQIVQRALTLAGRNTTPTPVLMATLTRTLVPSATLNAEATDRPTPTAKPEATDERVATRAVPTAVPAQTGSPEATDTPTATERPDPTREPTDTPQPPNTHKPPTNTPQPPNTHKPPTNTPQPTNERRPSSLTPPTERPHNRAHF